MQAVRPEGAEAHSPRQRLGLKTHTNHTPCKGKSLIIKVLPLQVGCSKFKYKSDTKSARIQLVKLLIFNLSLIHI